MTYDFEISEVTTKKLPFIFLSLNCILNATVHFSNGGICGFVLDKIKIAKVASRKLFFSNFYTNHRISFLVWTLQY